MGENREGDAGGRRPRAPFLASLAGPGRIWVQTLPIAKLAHRLMEYMPAQDKEAVQGGVVGGIVGSIVDGMK